MAAEGAKILKGLKQDVPTGMRVVAGVLAGDPEALSPLRERLKKPGESVSSRMLFKAKTMTDRLDKNSLGARMITNVYFKGGIHASIILSAILMGIQTQNHHGDSQDAFSLWAVSEHVFTFIFAAEMVLRVYVLRRTNFMSFWSVMDFCIAWISILDSWVLPLLPNSGDDENMNFQLFKVFRLLRLSRMLRFLNAVPELRMVVEGLAASMRALFWVTILLFMVVYAFSIFCVEVVGHDTTNYPAYSRNVTSANLFNNFEYFGSLDRSIVSLLSITFMAEWNAIRAVWELQWWVTIVFLCLIFISSFGIVNVIIGVIVEKITTSMVDHKNEHLYAHKVEVMRHFEAIADSLYEEIEELEGVSREEMCYIAEHSDHDMSELFANVEFPPGFTFDDLFTMLNIDGVGDLKKDEFLTGMRRLLFSNPTQKVCTSHLSLGQIKELLQAFWASHDETCKELQQEISDLRDCVKVVLETVGTNGSTLGPAKSQSSVKLPPRVPPSLDIVGARLGSCGSLLSLSALEPVGGAKCRRWEGRGHVREARRLKSSSALLPSPLSQPLTPAPFSPRPFEPQGRGADITSTSHAQSTLLTLPAKARKLRTRHSEAGAVPVGGLRDRRGACPAPSATLIGNQSTVTPVAAMASQIDVRAGISTQKALVSISPTSIDESESSLKPWRSGATYVQL